MILRGTLEISGGSARVGKVSLLTETFDEPGLTRAADFLHTYGFRGGEEIVVHGDRLMFGGKPVLMMTNITNVWSNSSFTLAGNPVSCSASVTCKQCGTVNIVPFFDPRNPPNCENEPPTHKLKIV